MAFHQLVAYKQVVHLLEAYRRVEAYMLVVLPLVVLRMHFHLHRRLVACQVVFLLVDLVLVLDQEQRNQPCLVLEHMLALVHQGP